MKDVMWLVVKQSDNLKYSGMLLFYITCQDL